MIFHLKSTYFFLLVTLGGDHGQYLKDCRKKIKWIAGGIFKFSTSKDFVRGLVGLCISIPGWHDLAPGLPDHLPAVGHVILLVLLAVAKRHPSADHGGIGFGITAHHAARADVDAGRGTSG